MKRWFFTLVGIMLVGQAVFYGGRVLLSWRTLTFGGDAVTIGWFTAAYSLVPLVIALPAGRLVDAGRAPTIMRIGLLSTALAPLLMAISTNLWVLLAGYVLLGFAHMTALIAGQGMVSKLRETASGLDSLFAYFTLGISIGQFIGIAVSGFVASRSESGSQAVVASVSTTSALYILTALGAVMLVVGWAHAGRFMTLQSGGTGQTGAMAGESSHVSSSSSGKGHPSQPDNAKDLLRTQGEHESLWEILNHRGMPSAMSASIAVIVAIDLLTAYMPVLGAELGLSVMEVTLILSARSGFGIISRAFMPTVLRTMNRDKVLVASTVMGALPMLAMPFVHNAWALAGLVGICGLAWGFVMPMTMTWVSGLVPDNERALALSVRLMGNRMAQVALPPVAGIGAAAMGTGAVLFASGVFLTATAATTARALLTEVFRQNQAE